MEEIMDDAGYRGGGSWGRRSHLLFTSGAPPTADSILEVSTFLLHVLPYIQYGDMSSILLKVCSALNGKYEALRLLGGLGGVPVPALDRESA
jgi:hypothetical protein